MQSLQHLAGRLERAPLPNSDARSWESLARHWPRAKHFLPAHQDHPVKRKKKWSHDLIRGSHQTLFTYIMRKRSALLWSVFFGHWGGLPLKKQRSSCSLSSDQKPAYSCSQFFLSVMILHRHATTPNFLLMIKSSILVWQFNPALTN